MILYGASGHAKVILGICELNKIEVKAILDDNEQITKLSGGDLSGARKYKTDDSFVVDELIDHPKFGVGVVLAIVKVNKVETLFKEGTKLLIQNQ